MSNLKPKLGFSLIEILIVISLIGLLSTVGYTGFQAITRSGRDGLRRSDLENIRSALEIYKAENNGYPPATSCLPDTGTLVPKYINAFPQDPKSPFRYCYYREATLQYKLCAHLENASTTDDFCLADPLVPEYKCGVPPASDTNCNYEVANP